MDSSKSQDSGRFDKFIIKGGFTRCIDDKCVYFKLVKGEMQVYLFLYVDHTLVASKNEDNVIEVKHILKTEFEINEPRLAKRIMGMDISRDKSKGYLFLSQSN